MFWTGMWVGAVIGCAVGIIVMGLCVAAKRGDDQLPCDTCEIAEDIEADKSICFSCPLIGRVDHHV